jgi:transcriptional regulator with XRE-family HTH domain
MQKREKDFATPASLEVAKKLGKAIHQARVARNRTREDLAQRSKIGRNTLTRLESGDVAVRMGAWLSALEATGLLHLLENAAEPAADVLGEVSRKQKPRVRARASKATDKDSYDF